MTFRRVSIVTYGALALGASAIALLWALRRASSFAEPALAPSLSGSAIGVDLCLVALFGLQHSAMARLSYRRAYGRLLPPSTERVTYTLASCLALALVVWLWRPLPGTVWRVEDPLGSVALTLLGGAGWALLGLSFLVMNGWELLGGQQVMAFGRSGRSHPTRFRTPGPYRHLRHPLMLGMLVGLWGAPVMGGNRAVFAAAMSAYILIGIWLEERDLLTEFGADYRSYRRQVPMLLPRIRKRSASRTD